MPEIKLKQLQYASNTWKHLLGSITEENIRLKSRLSAIIKEKFNNSLLEKAEIFQNSFIKEDELISLLRNDIAELDKLLEKVLFEDGTMIKEAERKSGSLNNKIEIAQKQFGKLKLEFNSYFPGNL
jgi:hypothetical protein